MRVHTIRYESPIIYVKSLGHYLSYVSSIATETFIFKYILQPTNKTVGLPDSFHTNIPEEIAAKNMILHILHIR